MPPTIDHHRRTYQQARNLILVFSVLAFVGCAAPSAILRQRAQEAIQAGNWPLAADNLNLVLTRTPSDSSAQIMLANVRLNQKRPLEAQILLEQALATNPNNQNTPAILDGLAESLYQQHETAALTSFLHRTASERLKTPDFLRSARYLALAGDHDSAVVAYQKAIAFAPSDDPTPYTAMADFYESLGDKAQAVTCLRHAHYVVPNDYSINQRLRAYGIVPGPTVALPTNKQ